MAGTTVETIVEDETAPADQTVAPAATPVVEIEDEATPLAPTVDGTGITEIEDEEVPLAVIDETEDMDDVVEIEDEEAPLANGKSRNRGKRVWWWWILVIIAAITGKTAYDKKNKKGIFAEKAVAENTDNTEDKEQ